jgi:hypothetical protein
MYEVHPDNKGGWNLYEVGDGGCDLVATFADKADAEFARVAFVQRDAQSQQDCFDQPVVVTSPRA